MNSSPILVVEDNAITGKMLRVTLETEGFAVLSATTGKECLKIVKEQTPCLVLMDFRLPDYDGIALAHQVKLLPNMADVPLVACTGFISETSIEQKLLSVFNGYLIKPVEPARLVKVIRGFLSTEASETQEFGEGKTILVADDDATQLKLIRLHLQNLGFQVLPARDGQQALEIAKRHPPDVVLSDVLMPVMDGFKLTSLIRQESSLAKVPIILSTAYFIDENDKLLAKRLGANDLVLRTPHLEEIVHAIQANLNAGVISHSTHTSEMLETEYQQRMLLQLERQAALNLQLTQQCSQQATALSVLGSISEAVLKKLDFEPSLPAILAQCFDVAGISLGALYLREPDGKLHLKAQVGFSEKFIKETEFFFNRAEISEQISHKTTCLAVSAKLTQSGPYLDLLKLCNVNYVLLVPVISQLEPTGILLMASRAIDLAHPDWATLGQALGNQIGQAVALGNMISQLAISEKRYKTLMQNANDGLIVLSKEGFILEANDRALELLKTSHEKLIGKHFTTRVDPTHLDIAMQSFTKITTEGRALVKSIRVKTDDGGIREVDFSTSVVNLGKDTVVFSVAHDVTEQNLIESQLRQSQKMEALGQLTGGIAHDFNNVLSIIGLYAESLSKSTDPAKINEGTHRILQAQKKAAALTKQLLAFSRKQVIEPQILNLNDILKDMNDMATRLIGENIFLSMNFDPHLNNVFVDRGNIEQVIMNLLVNSRDAMPNGGTITLKTQNVDVNQSDLPNLETDVSMGSYSLMTITDTGSGMNAETLSKIFEPFFTTKGIGKGTGLGLATTHGIIHQAKGFIKVSSTVGVGTTFNIYLPKSSDSLVSVVPQQQVVQPLKGSETILLAEDETMLREIVASSLRDEGYQILEAANGQEVLSLMKNSASKIDLIITDVIMPDLSGSQLVQKIRESRKDIKVLYLSGYTEDILVQNDINSTAVYFMDKPFNIEDLLARARHILNSKV